ncbi:MAG: hypothetical protein HYZ74_05360, partial [Elusimicrobia bacterium]|nr:hypothetical protein [Elusimicrobiota bacterium]
MLREHRRLLDAIHAAMTVIWIAFAFVLVHALLMSQGHPILPLDFYLNAIVVFCGLVVVAVNQTDFSAAAPLSRPGSLLRGLASCWALGLIGFFSFAYMFRIPHYSRLFL